MTPLHVIIPASPTYVLDGIKNLGEHIFASIEQNIHVDVYWKYLMNIIQFFVVENEAQI